MNIYADTSVFGGVFDTEFEDPSRRFFDEIDAGRFVLVTSAIRRSRNRASSRTHKAIFQKHSIIAEVAAPDETAFALQDQYLKAGIVKDEAASDALHVALATVSKCDLIVSWNFRHIVNFDKIPKFNAVNILNGHHEIGIYSPLEVIGYDYS